MKMTVQEYRDHAAISYSRLKHYLKSPLHGLMQQPPSSESAAIRFGSAFDAACKGQFDQIVVNPFEDGRTKEAKQFKAENKGRLLISQSEMERINHAFSQFTNHAAVKSLRLEFFEDDPKLFGEIEGIPVKGMPDWKLGGQIVDLKTTGNGINPEQFARTVDAYGWDIQAAMYMELAKQNGDANAEFYWLAVESDIPNDCVVYRCSDLIKNVGAAKLKVCLQNYKKALAGDESGICTTISELSMPSWYGRQFAE